jgi:hypothetical protein
VRQMEVADDSTLHCTHGDGEGRECGEEEVEVMKSKTRQHDRLASRPKVRPRVEMVTATVWLWLGAPLPCCPFKWYRRVLIDCWWQQLVHSSQGHASKQSRMAWMEHV